MCIFSLTRIVFLLILADAVTVAANDLTEPSISGKLLRKSKLILCILNNFRPSNCYSFFIGAPVSTDQSQTMVLCCFSLYGFVAIRFCVMSC